MKLHPSTFQYHIPTAEQFEVMEAVRKASATYADVLDALLPDGPDKTWVIRHHRTTAMWANVAITRQANGAPRD